jgi:hypothetical protein
MWILVFKFLRHLETIKKRQLKGGKGNFMGKLEHKFYEIQRKITKMRKLAACGSQSHVTTDSQSVCLGVEPTLGLVILLPV